MSVGRVTSCCVSHWVIVDVFDDLHSDDNSVKQQVSVVGGRCGKCADSVTIGAKGSVSLHVPVNSDSVHPQLF